MLTKEEAIKEAVANIKENAIHNLFAGAINPYYDINIGGYATTIATIYKCDFNEVHNEIKKKLDDEPKEISKDMARALVKTFGQS